jgi:2-dehydro-3-deoxygluconokinase
MNELLGTMYSYSNIDFIESSKAFIVKFPSIEKIFDKIRTSSISSSRHKIKARMWKGIEFKATTELDFTHIADGIGSGDASAAGIIHDLLNFDDDKAMEFGNAACAIKQTYSSNVNSKNEKEVFSILKGNVTGRLHR